MGLETAQSNAAWLLRYRYSVQHNQGALVRVGEGVSRAGAVTAPPQEVEELVKFTHKPPNKLAGTFIIVVELRSICS